MISGRSIVGGKEAGDNDFAIRLKCHFVDQTEGPTPRIESGIQGAIRLDSGDVIARDAVIAGEASTNDQLAVGLQRRAIDSAIWSGARGETPVKRAIGIEPR